MTRIPDGEALYMPTRNELDGTPQDWRFGPDVKTSSVAVLGTDGVSAFVGLILADARGVEFFALSPANARAVARRLLERAELADGEGEDE